MAEIKSTSTTSSSTSSSSGSSSRKTSHKSESNQVRYTGDWSADSKLSAINYGYWEDPFFRFFNCTDPGRIRRTSLICRGYYVRFRVCDYFLRKFVRTMSEPIQVVSLGCGMDTTFFRILPELENYILRFYELDFKSVITTKKSIILHNEILRVMGEDKLRLLHCDLRYVASLEEALKSSDFDFKKPTLFYSECVVNYLRPNENFKILQWISENVPNSLWLAYEQCNANDPFGQIMVSHFLKNGCPLLSLLSAQSREDQEMQLLKANFSVAKVFNVWDAFLKIGKNNPPYFPNVSIKEQQFDEYEQLLATCLHYSVRIGMNGKFIGSEKLFNIISDFEADQASSAFPNCPKMGSQNSFFKTKSYRSPGLPKLTGHRSLVVAENQTILTFGGSGENSLRMKHLIASLVDFNGRNNSELIPELNFYPSEEACDDEVWMDSNELQVDSRILSENPRLYERLHASIVFVPHIMREGELFDSALIFGGRKSPSSPCTSDLIELNLENPLEKGEVGSVILSPTYGKCPPPRWRHSMALCLKNGAAFVLLFGGRDSEKVLGDCWLYSVEDFSWSERSSLATSPPENKVPSEPAARHSHFLISDADGCKLFMIGGVSKDDTSLCEDAFWCYDPVKDSWKVDKQLSLYTRRIGHSVEKYKNFLIVVGGYGANSSSPLDFFAAVIDLSSKDVKLVSQDFPREELFLPFGFSTCLIKGPEDNQAKIVIFGGGGNCFSFGTHYNQVCHVISLDDSKKSEQAASVFYVN